MILFPYYETANKDLSICKNRDFDNPRNAQGEWGTPRNLNLGFSIDEVNLVATSV